tara:strand:- start:2361 stop:2939 length:579 start_codon:yes stop_codon:yes gene_type:complete
MRSLKVETPAATEILTTAEVKLHLKVDTSADDTLILNLIKAATQSAEIFTNRFFIETEVYMNCDQWHEISPLYKSPVLEMVNVKYYDSASDSHTLLNGTNYILDNSAKPARLTKSVTGEFPGLSERKPAINIRYKVGFGETASDVPEGIKQAVLLTIGNWYENRQEIVIGRIATELPKSAQYLLEQYKVQTC